MKIDRRNIEQNLPAKGFQREAQGHHVYFHHMHEGKPTGAYTYVSHSPKFREISKGILTAMKRQLHLDSSAQVADLANCPMSGEQYLQHLRDKGLLD